MSRARRIRQTLRRHADGAGMIVPVEPAEKAHGERAKSWAGRCYEIACALVKAGACAGRPVYGHWTGPIKKGTPFDRGAPFARHGWVVLDGGSIYDPTRWVFEGVEPYIYIGPAHEYYDEGGNQWRAVMRVDPPEYDPSDKHYEVTQRLLPTPAWNFAERYLQIGTDQEPGWLTEQQLCYLANAPAADLGEHAEAIYTLIEALGRVALIPLDNYERFRHARFRRRFREGA
jgi:hypothetical protein